MTMGSAEQRFIEMYVAAYLVGLNMSGQYIWGRSPIEAAIEAAEDKWSEFCEVRRANAVSNATIQQIFKDPSGGLRQL